MKIYFCIATIFSILVLAKCDRGMETNQKLEECRKEAGVTEETLKVPQNSNDPKSWCVSACLMKKKGVMVDGKAIAEKVIEDISQDMPEAAKAGITTETPECVNRANKENDECRVFMVLRDCLIEKRLFR